MGTHSNIGFYYKNKLHLFYKHFDGYYSGVGCDLLTEIINMLQSDPNLQLWRDNLDKVVNMYKSSSESPIDISADNFSLKNLFTDKVFYEYCGSRCDETHLYYIDFDTNTFVWGYSSTINSVPLTIQYLTFLNKLFEVMQPDLISSIML